MLHFIAGLAIGICGTLCAVYIAPIIIRGILPEARELGSGFAAEQGPLVGTPAIGWAWGWLPGSDYGGSGGFAPAFAGPVVALPEPGSLIMLLLPMIVMILIGGLRDGRPQ